MCCCWARVLNNRCETFQTLQRLNWWLLCQPGSQIEETRSRTPANPWVVGVRRKPAMMSHSITCSILTNRGRLLIWHLISPFTKKVSLTD